MWTNNYFSVKINSYAFNYFNVFKDAGINTHYLTYLPDLQIMSFAVEGKVSLWFSDIEFF